MIIGATFRCSRLFMVDVVINLNKPKDISSQQAVTKVKKILAARKAGHAGTLDPIATGVLIICLNEATKITRFLVDLDKQYCVRLKLGERTDTYDLTGKVLEKRDCPHFEETDIMRMLRSFTGQIRQVPPMYSAIKVGGQPLYKIARRGIDVKRQERTVTVYGIDLIRLDLPYLDLRVTCSRGTYIRTLCDDIGKALGPGGYMVSLERTKIGNFRIEDAASPEELKEKKAALHSIDEAIAHLDELLLDEESSRRARRGMSVIGITKNFTINQYIRLKDPEENLLGIGRAEKNRIRIERLLN